jgi:rubrerythrin
MFTIADLRSIAIQIERNGEAAYRQASMKIKDPGLARLLELMAEDEKKHLEWFEKLNVTNNDACEMAEVEKLGQALLQDMMDKQTFALDERQLVETDDILGLLSQSRSFEEDTILFYETLSGFIDDAKVARHLELIIAEERAHAQKLQDFIAAKEDGAKRKAPSA